MSGFEFDIGILGGGQLARMSAMAATRMGLRCLTLDPAADSPAAQVASSVQGPLTDAEKIAEVMRRSGRVTLENEFTPASAVRTALDLSGRDESCLVPGSGPLETIQDKLAQRKVLAQAGIPGPRAWAAGGLTEFPMPGVLKSRFGGYDGKGTRVYHTRAELNAFLDEIDPETWLVEEYVDFQRELAVMVTSSTERLDAFPTVVSVQVDNVCDLVYPSTKDGASVARAAIEVLGGYGLYGVELFEDQRGEILVNEIAPRPHNSGHYTMDWGGISQFEAHIRLVMGYELPELAGLSSCMANLLGQAGSGDHRIALQRALESEPDARFHWYGKAQSRPGRKMGHINTVGDDCVSRAVAAREAFYQAWTAGPA